MLTRYIKAITGASLGLLICFSGSSMAGDAYGKIGYRNHPFNVVVGYDGHKRHHGYRNHRAKHHFVPRHRRYNQRVHRYNNRQRGHFYRPAGRYCR